MTNVAQRREKRDSAAAWAQPEPDLARGAREFDAGLARLVADTPDARLAETALDFALDHAPGGFGLIRYIEEAGEPDNANDFAEFWLRRSAPAATQGSRRKTPAPVAQHPYPAISNRSYVLAGGPVAISRSMQAELVFRGRRCGAIVVANGPRDYSADDFARLRAIAERLAPVFWALASERARTRTAAGFREARTRLDSILDTAVDAIIGVTFNGKIETVNPAAARMFGYEREELLGRKIKSLLPNLDRREQEQYRWRCQETGQRGVFYAGKEETGIRKNGTAFPLEMSVGVADEGGKEIFIGIMRDITKRKAAEAQLGRHAEELARSNRELDDFAYIASHDLKAPLRGIHNYASFLLEDYGSKLDAEGQAKLQTLGRLAKRMEDIINDLLNFSRVGRTELSYADVDLNAVVADVVDTLKVFLAEANATVTVAAPLPRIHCDQVRVRAVFQNFITNGVKYNDSAEKRIEIAWRAAAEGESAGPGPGQGPVFSIADNGIGIPEKHREKIFGIFKRLHSGDKYGGGTGAGLAIVKKIVEQHQGRIWLDSELGRGTTFHFTLGDTPASEAAP